MFREAKGNMWRAKDPDAIVITTNGFVKKSGWAVMGRGCAKEATTIWPKFPLWLGGAIRKGGNHVYHFSGLPWAKDGKMDVFTFPVKHNWWEKADLDLIHQSCIELVQDVDFWSQGDFKYQNIVMPRPGCGNGGLAWGLVRPVLAKYLDERFVVYHYE